MSRGDHEYLNAMSKEDLDRLATQLDRINSMLSVARVIMGGVGMCVAGLITVALWANNTTTALAQTRADLTGLIAVRAESSKEWSAWRTKKDETDTQLLQIVANQQRMLDREQTILDRLSERLAALPIVKTP